MKRVNATAELEIAFQAAFSDWKKTKSRQAYDKVFLYVENAVNAFLSKKLKGIYRDDFDDIKMEAVIQVMKQINNAVKKCDNFEIKKLINYVSLPTYYTLYNPKRAFSDKQIRETDLSFYNSLEEFETIQKEKYNGLYPQEW